jgi:ribonuclease VapC
VIAVDTSAIVAILWREPDAKRLRERLRSEESAVISAGSVLELQFVVAGTRTQGGWDQVEALLGAYQIAIRPFDDAQLRIARDAAQRFGKGRHRASLNFGDCFAYALAKAEGLSLLCKGDDFAHTDIGIA